MSDERLAISFEEADPIWTAVFALRANPGDAESGAFLDAIGKLVLARIAAEREECAKEMERREVEVANTIDTKAAYRNAARAIRARTP